MTLDSQESSATVSANTRRAIVFEGCANGIGNIDRLADRATYTLYKTDTDTVEFPNTFYSTRKRFQP